MVHVRRYYIDETWTPRKLEVKIDVPEYLSLEKFRATGPQVCYVMISLYSTLSKIVGNFVFDLQEGEKIQPEIVEEANDILVQELSAMGFPIENCKKALLATGNKGKLL